MNRNTNVLLLALVTCAAWTWAQETPLAQSTSQSQQSPQSTSTSPPPAKGTLWSANESIGADVIGANGEDLGSVEDIVLDRDLNRIAYVIVSYGGVLDIGDKHFAVPWQAFGQTADRELSLGIDPERLKNAPGFEKGTLPNTADPLFHEEVYSFYDAKPYSAQWLDKEEGDAPATQDEAGDGVFDWGSWVSRGDDSTWARRLEEVIGTNIENTKGDTIAELEDVIVDSREARAAYAVVSYGGTLGFFEDTAIIPWNVIRLDLGREAYVTEITTGQLEQAKLSDTEYRNLEDRKYSEALYGTFKTKPYWEEFGYETGSDQTSRTAEPSNKPDETPAAADSEQDRNTVTGTVVSVGNYAGTTPETQAERGVRIRVRTESGLIRTVHLATSEALRQQDLTLNRGDEVTITGELRDYRGHKVLAAREVQKDGKTVTLGN